VTARQEAPEPEVEAEEESHDIASTQQVKAARVAARANASYSAREDESGTAVDKPAVKDEEGSKWGSRLFLLAFFGAIGGLLYLEPVRNMLRPGYEAAVAWVKTELELTPPPPPPDTSTWPPPQKPRPPNPLAPEENPAPSQGTATAEPPKTEPDPQPAQPEAPENSGEAVAKAGQGTKAGTSKPKGQTGTKGEPGKKPGETGAQTASKDPRDLEGQLADEPNTTVEQNPEGEAVVLDTKDPRKMRKAGIGLLTLYTVPRAAVFDGQTSLGTTPLMKVPLQAGTYRLRVVDPEGNSRLFSAPVELAKDNKYTIKVSDLPPYEE
jgi:serine/threonine-protein kinase